jgi:hypothetical protein
MAVGKDIGANLSGPVQIPHFRMGEGSPAEGQYPLCAGFSLIPGRGAAGVGTVGCGGRGLTEPGGEVTLTVNQTEKGRR